MKLIFSQTSGMVESWFYPYGMPKFFMEDGDEVEVSERMGKKLLSEYPNNLSIAKVELPKIEKETESAQLLAEVYKEEKEIVFIEEKVIPSNYFKLKSEAIKNDYDKSLGLGKELLIKFLIGKGYVTV